MENVGEGVFILNDQFKGKGLGVQLNDIFDGLKMELGFPARMNDSFVSNYHLHSSIAAAIGAIHIGTVPKIGYRDGVGWEDSLIKYLDFKKYKGKPFLRLEAVSDVTEVIPHRSSKL